MIVTRSCLYHFQIGSWCHLYYSLDIGGTYKMYLSHCCHHLTTADSDVCLIASLMTIYLFHIISDLTSSHLPAMRAVAAAWSLVA